MVASIQRRASRFPGASFSQGFDLEKLEPRQLMSASALHAPVHVAATTNPALVESEGNGSAKPVNTTVTHGAGPKSVPIRPSLIEPQVDSDVVSWMDVSKNPLFAPGGPSPDDVQQGYVGDCWFVATLAEIASQNPNLIRQDIHQRADGTYDVYFHESKNVVVDEHVDGKLPENYWGTLEYASLGTDGCTWVAIMEKAFTYFRDPSIAPSYDTIAGGWGSEALADLGATGISELLPSVSNAKKLFSDIAIALSNGQAVDLGTNWWDNGPLVNDHEYSVVGVQYTKAGGDQIEVRNPWGFNPNFTPSANGYNATNDGYLWLSASSVLPEMDEFVTANV